MNPISLLLAELLYLERDKSPCYDLLAPPQQRKRGGLGGSALSPGPTPELAAAVGIGWAQDMRSRMVAGTEKGLFHKLCVLSWGLSCDIK